MTLDELYKNEQFDTFYHLLLEWNNKFNLTSLSDHDDIYLKHFYDSILPADLFPPDSAVLDVGSGAGFPGICLKLVRPDLDITLLDSVGKKVSFLEEAISVLSLGGIRAVKSRIEDFKQRTFDVVTARAVASVGILAEYCLPFVKTGGFALFYKSADIADELHQAENALAILGGRVETVVKRSLTDEITRSFVLIRKISESPLKYPRGGNKPRLNPL